MNSKLWIQKALSMCLVIAVIAGYSTVGLAGTGKVAGELLITGKSANGEAPFAKVNGETAKSGRSIFSSSTVATPENTNAVINLGRIGSLELAPETTLILSFNEKEISGELLAGQVMVLSASEDVNIKMLDGSTLKLNAGGVAAANGAARQTGGGSSWLPFALIFGGAVAGIVVAAVLADNDKQLGGGSVVVSPTR